MIEIGPKLIRFYGLLMLVYSFSQKVCMGPQMWSFSRCSFTLSQKKAGLGVDLRENEKISSDQTRLKTQLENLCFEPVKSTVSLVSTF